MISRSYKVLKGENFDWDGPESYVIWETKSYLWGLWKVRNLVMNGSSQYYLGMDKVEFKLLELYENKSFL